MVFEPKSKNRIPDVIIVASFVCAGICFAFSNFDFVYGKGILQTLSLAFFCVMIFMLVKYKFTKLRYTVRKKEESSEDTDIKTLPPSALELYIERAQGTRGFVGECLIALDDITDFCEVPLNKADRKVLRSKYANKPKFKYYITLVGGKGYLIEMRTKDGIAAIEIEAEGELVEYLSAVAEYNRKNLHSED